MKFLLVDPPHKIWEFLRAWVPSPACLQLAAYIENDFDCVLLEQDEDIRSLVLTRLQAGHTSGG